MPSHARASGWTWASRASASGASTSWRSTPSPRASRARRPTPSSPATSGAASAGERRLSAVGARLSATAVASAESREPRPARHDNDLRAGTRMALYAFDGTWNEEHDAGIYGVNTNVVEFARAYDGRLAVVQKPETEGGPTVRDDFYVSGPGTRHGTLGKWFGGAMGAGGRDRVEEATRAAAARFAEGDEAINVVGFSRGAALALHFTNVLAGRTFRTRAGQEVKPTVRFLGLWDVVAAFGIPLDLGPLSFQRINLGYKL